MSAIRLIVTHARIRPDFSSYRRDRLRVPALAGMLWLALLVAVNGFAQSNTASSPGRNATYAGSENALVKLGLQRVVRTIAYPEWFQYPGMAKEIRQQLVDDYTAREFMVSLEKSAGGTAGAKPGDAAQWIVDLFGSWGIKDISLSASPTPEEINRTLKEKAIPRLVKSKSDNDPAFDLDVASDKQDDYKLPSGWEIRLLDKELAYLARHQNIPISYKPSAGDIAVNPVSRTLDRTAFLNGLDGCRRQNSTCRAGCPTYGLDDSRNKAPQVFACLSGCDSAYETCNATFCKQQPKGLDLSICH